MSKIYAKLNEKGDLIKIGVENEVQISALIIEGFVEWKEEKEKEKK